MACQQRLCFARVGVIEPLSLADYQAHGGFAGLRRALALGPAAIVEEVVTSGLRGRGGAGFPDRHQVAHHGSGRGIAEIHRLQRRRGRQRHLRRPDADGGRPLHPGRGHGHRRHRRRATKGFVYIRSEYPHAFRQMLRAIHIAQASRPARRRRAGQRPALPSGGPPGCRGLYLRRGDLAAGEPRGQARPDPLQAAAARHRRPVRQAHRRQQRHQPRQRALDPGPWRCRLSRLRHGPLARHHADPARRQHPPWRADRARLRPHPARAGRGFGRRHRQRPAGPRGAGRRPAWAPTGRPSLLDTPLDYEEFARRGGMVGHGGIVVFDDTVDLGSPGPLRLRVLRPSNPAASAPPAASARPAAPRPSTGSSRASGSPRTCGWSTISARC